jgi:hypothetical protein
LPLGFEKTIKLDHLEEVKVVTRFPKVNLRKDHYPLRNATISISL